MLTKQSLENNSATFLKSNYSGILFTVIVALLCLYPFEAQKASSIPHFDKVIHLTLFLILSFFWMRGLTVQNQFKKLQAKAVLVTVISVIAYGVLIEILQDVMHLGRTFDGWDIAADAVGVMFGFGIFRVVRD